MTGIINKIWSENSVLNNRYDHELQKKAFKNPTQKLAYDERIFTDKAPSLFNAATC